MEPYRASHSAFVVRIRKIRLLIGDDGDVVGLFLSPSFGFVKNSSTEGIKNNVVWCNSDYCSC